MSINVSSVPIFANDAKPPSNITRPSAKFHPSIWKDYFLSYVHNYEDNDDNIKEIQLLKEEVRKMIVSPIDNNFIFKLKFIDSIQRLGVSYHFESEIDGALHQIYNLSTKENIIITYDYDLYHLALLFRLFRQQGYPISPTVFNKFKDVEGNFSESLVSDVEGMLCFYEASHIRVRGEDILEEALAFTSTHLESIATQLSPSLQAQINHSLKQALHKNVPRLEAKRYISIYEQDPSHNKILLTFAKLDFNKLQKLHQKEFGNICKWWNEMDVPGKLPFVRDRIIENCFWNLGVYFEPQFSQARKIMTKVSATLSIIDDTYDAYGTIDELELLTEAIERWDISCLDDLPEYMKFSYKLLLNVFEEIEQETKKEGITYCVNYSIKELKKVIQAYMTEAKWLNNNYIPTTEELMDDIVSNEFEKDRGHVSSFLECYMSEYGESREVAIHECQKRITNAWKDVNEECLRPTTVPMPFLMRILNLNRCE
ncbi:hypothetical protein VNO78_06294 [Psophocarpus tetragonolobus]|uniref:Sesquiterpene synthase n=1 Tax=Psophocarpus tetragonolobus TaxID=3891 RepID=A0AAN9XRN6_PSOTE